MSIIISRRSVWMVGMLTFLVLGLILTACGGAAPTTEAPAPTEEVAEATTPAQDTPVMKEEPEPTDTSEEEMVEESSAESEASDQVGTAAACLSADPNTDPIAGAIVFLDEYIEAGQINEGIPAVTDADWAKGPADAPVTIIEFGDFQ